MKSLLARAAGIKLRGRPLEQRPTEDELEGLRRDITKARPSVSVPP